MSKSKFSPELARILGRIDSNTRCIAKIISGFEHAEDTDGCEYLEEREKLKRMAVAELIQRRRALKLQFEDEWKRLQTSA